MRLSRSGAAFGSLAGVALLVTAAAAATEITDATVDQRLSQAEAAFRQGGQGEALRLLNDVTSWANHSRDGRRGMRDPAADAAFAERIYQRALATIGRTFGAATSTPEMPSWGLRPSTARSSATPSPRRSCAAHLPS